MKREGRMARCNAHCTRFPLNKRDCFRADVRDVNAEHVNPSRYNWIRRLVNLTANFCREKHESVDYGGMMVIRYMVGSMDYPFLCAAPRNSFSI